MSKSIPQPFQNIALSLSGGGYRASAFHLGSMSYLHHAQWNGAPMISQLVVLSTISGGTITGMKYALSLAENKSVQAFFKEVYTFLKEDALLGKALEILNEPKAWEGSLKQRNLINAFALVYHQYLLSQQNFGALLDLPNEGYPEMIFNSTDLEHQMAFRFQKSENGLIGNREVSVSKAAAREIRLADITAASSCFPGGFEPLHFHQDFATSETSPLAMAGKTMQMLRLMDGGIVDNQGIESILLFEERKNNSGEPFIGTYLISDVTRKQLIYPDLPEKASSFLLHFSIRFYNVVAILLIIASIGALWMFQQKWIAVVATMLLTVGSIWLIAGYLIVKNVVHLLKKTLSKGSSSSMLGNLNILRSVQLKYVIDQLYTRVISVGRLPDVFMKRIRDQGFRKLFSDQNWNYRIRTNLIYKLLESDTISANLKVHVEKANQMGTTLWFAEEAPGTTPTMLDALVITGQATLCANLIEYIEEMKDKLYPRFSPELRAALDQLQANCRADFERFNGEPGWMLNSYVSHGTSEY